MWQIDTDTFYIDKKLKKFRADKAIIDGFKRAVNDLATSNDPRKIGELKHGQYTEIEKKIELIESGKAKGKTYTPDEYLKYVNKVLENTFVS